MSSVATPAAPDVSDTGQPFRDRTSAEVKRTVQALEDLNKSYQNRAIELPKQHIGVYVKEISSIALPPGCHYDSVLKIRSLVRSTMIFVLDQYHDIARLNELDDNQWTPLHYAISWNATDCLEILMARGADPYNTFCTETPFQKLFDKELREYATTRRYILESRGLVYLRDLVKLWHDFPNATENSEHLSLTCRTSNITGMSIEPIYGSQEIRLGQDLLKGAWTYGWEPTEYRTWIHVSFTNVPVLYNICRTIEGIVNKNRSNAEQIQVMESFCSVLRPPVVTPGNPLLTYRDSMYCSLYSREKTVGSAMVFPYLVLERISALLESRVRYKGNAEGTKGLPASKYGMGDPTFLGLCLGRTLDEAYFPSMDDAFFEKKNKDQVISREWRRTSKKANPDSAPLLLVSQTWLWNFNDSVLLSAYSIKRTSSRSPRFSMNGGRMVPHFFGHGPAPSIELQMGLIIAGQIFEFGEEHDREDKGSKFKSALHMFETAVISALNDVQRYLDAKPGSYNIKQQKKQEQGFIHNMSDIHSELDMITSVLEQQKKIMNKFLRETKTQQESATGQEQEGWAMVKEARAMLNDYEDRVQKIHRDADRVDKTIESYLNLKRTYASIEDTRNSLIIGFATTAFAFVTVIFTPLSFMTSLFALPVDRFTRHQYKEAGSEDSVFKSSYIGGYTALAGIVTWVLTVAFLVGLYYGWKISSRPGKDENKTDTTDTQADRTTRNSVGHDRDDRTQNGDDSRESKSIKSGGLRGAKLWHRKTHGEDPSSV